MPLFETFGGYWARVLPLTAFVIIGAGCDGGNRH